MHEMPTLTLTPQGVPAHQWASGDCQRPASASTCDLQNLDHVLQCYTGSHNLLINACAPLLGLCGVLTRLSSEAEIGTTRMELTRAIVDLKFKVVQQDYPPSVAEHLCLLFAIAFDEFIMASSWGKDSGWENRTLVADLFGFRDGGDRFYKIAERALLQPKALREFLEIVCIILKLGFRGKYPHGAERERDLLIDRLNTALSLTPFPDVANPVGRPVVDLSLIHI